MLKHTTFSTYRLDAKITNVVNGYAQKYCVDLNTVRPIAHNCYEVGEPKTGNTILIRVRNALGFALIDAFHHDKPKGHKRVSIEKRPTHIEISARRWTDGYGNTYHAVNVHVDDEHVFTDNFTYGYGDHYLETAKAGLIEQGLIPSDVSVLWRYCQEKNIRLYDSVCDVKTKKSLAFN